jgi:glycosyl hydrolase family 59/F5/8 type C domain-containing protein/glycosyl hydrolase family 59 (putative galactocerebrosidase)
MSRRWAVVVLAVLAAVLTPVGSASAAPTRIVVDGTGPGRVFDGVGAVSAGGSSRLLVDYPPAERAQILDYLFRPGYGAALDILKVEIGGDTDATSGAEPSHQRERGQVDCGRGYEWWLIDEAKARNPDIRIYAVAWGAAGWLEGGYWTADGVEYLMSWVDCAEQRGVTVDYLAGRNESGYDRDFSVALDQALADRGYATEVVAADDHTPPDYWQVADDLAADPEFAAAVDVLGSHDVCHWRTPYEHCDVSDAALATGKPLWNSEQSTEDYADWAMPLARAMNRNYLDARVTANINWAPVAAFYGTFPAAGTGLILADQPWSGSYALGNGVWVDAHTTQFTDPGWGYLDGASGYLPGGSSYVSLRAPERGDVSVVVETVDATAPETAEFAVTGGLSTGPLYLWSTDLTTDDPAQHFVPLGPVPRNPDGSVTVTFEPGHVYTLSTTTGQGKGTDAPAAARDQQLPVPYQETFEQAGDDRLAPYFSDVAGAFETAPCAAGRAGTCYRQVVGTAPIAWHSHVQPPTTVVGDPRWWGDYEVSTRFLLEEPGYVELLGRVEAQPHRVAGYHLVITDAAGWRLYTEDIAGTQTTLAQGAVPIGVGSWHQAALRFTGRTVAVVVDGRQVGSVSNYQHLTGQVGLRTKPWIQAQFDDVTVTPTREWPRFVPDAAMTATASSANTEPYQGMVFPAAKAVDDRPESMWHSDFTPARQPLPQSVTLDLGQSGNVHGLAYQPRLDGVPNGTVTGYTVATSTDGVQYTEVASGQWASTVATKLATWQGRPARFVRLTATAGTGDLAAAGEIDIATTPIPLSREETD